ncbi:cytochrome c oxidase subunit II [Corynebacterium sp. 320]|uniref:cytochrome-c oxidase n=1 Tax=Corynebacterium zhongnanshanii TaxID=2768834 RepID=A0ABQ6VGT1_9CORY|nr:MULTISPECIES: cytochrome c oxidase subunit II [Corynebacterium]KAB1502474.1 cytochrome c oxidase subunit II [Corynebacterium sp. 320]KAB1551305.1 cytochrome c oxidase subunit II [Corynebacterium sp. 321]KAB1551867.1 cytochrome c oxidase subunit II [Corynebacterium sp. 319]KAB3520844.1 cytochrome c oxidase subunit II [Corynebacterium zhongnanshanii]KAB3526081.1 cytochrome c oxidase subunit II [Corynebacterium sp. 250]
MEQRKVHGLTRRLGLAGVLGFSGLALAGCTVNPPENKFFELLRFGWPKGITPEAQQLGNFWVWVWVAAWIIGFIMWGLMFFVMARYNDKARTRRGDHEEFPRQTAYNVPLELVLTLMPVLTVLTLFFFNVQAQDEATALDKDPEVTVDVTAFQWNWKFGYANVYGEKLTDEAAQKAAEESKYEDLGVDKHGHPIPGPIHGKSKDDYSHLRFSKIETTGTTEEIPVLVLPSNTAIEFDLASADVSHAFWVPEFLFKRDVYNHPEANQQERRFQVREINKEGAFVGRCAEMCGTYHAMMNFEIRVVSPEKFKQYIEFRKQNPDAPNSAALKEINEAPYATSTHPFETERAGTRTANENYTDRNAA